MGIVKWFRRLFGLEQHASESIPSTWGTGRLTAAQVLAEVRVLSASRSQWQEIWSRLNPTDDPFIQELLLALRNDGLQFAPSDGLSRIETACEGLLTTPGADTALVLKATLGRLDVLDKFR